jgi:hypothetical protein
MPKKKTPALAPRKKNPPRTAYTKENPSPHAFKPGQSGNPSGKSKNMNTLLSHGLRGDLADRASNEECTKAGLPAGCSNSQVIRARLMIIAKKGDPAQTLAAIREIRELTELKGGTSVNVGIAIGANGEPVSTEGPRLRVFFIESDGNGGISPETQAKITALEALKDAGVEEVPPHLALEVPYNSKTGIDYGADSAIVEDDDGPVIEGELLGPMK